MSPQRAASVEMILGERESERKRGTGEPICTVALRVQGVRDTQHIEIDNVSRLLDDVNMWHSGVRRIRSRARGIAGSS
jgi:hypothetical protein